MNHSGVMPDTSKCVLVTASSKGLGKVIAKELGISVRYLHWLFKHSEETVTQYLTRKRIELAQLLLTSSSKSLYSVTEVAFMCGFNDSTHFSRRFKQQVGISPSVYRTENFTGPN